MYLHNKYIQCLSQLSIKTGNERMACYTLHEDYVCLEHKLMLALSNHPFLTL